MPYLMGVGVQVPPPTPSISTDRFRSPTSCRATFSFPAPLISTSRWSGEGVEPSEELVERGDVRATSKPLIAHAAAQHPLNPRNYSPLPSEPPSLQGESGTLDFNASLDQFDAVTAMRGELDWDGIWDAATDQERRASAG